MCWRFLSSFLHIVHFGRSETNGRAMQTKQKILDHEITLTKMLLQYVKQVEKFMQCYKVYYYNEYSNGKKIYVNFHTHR